MKVVATKKDRVYISDIFCEGDKKTLRDDGWKLYDMAGVAKKLGELPEIL